MYLMLLAALLSVTASPDTDGPDRHTPPAASVDILPLLELRRETRNLAGSSADSSNAYVGGYTRFVIVGLPALPSSGQPSARIYDHEDRGPFRRFMSARSLTRVLSIRTLLSRPNVNTTTTLMTANQESNSRQGESWTTEQHERLYLTPYFRVSSTTSSTIEASLNASSSIQGEVTGAVIGMLMEGSKLVAPSSTLITSASEARLVQASDYLSKTVSRLFSQTLSEKSSTQFGPAEWGSQSIIIEAWLPSHRRISTNAEARLVGRWEIKAEPAIVSIFNPVPYCPSGCGSQLANLPKTPESLAQAAFEGLSPQTVLNFDLDGTQTIVQAIRSDPAVARALDALARVPPKDPPSSKSGKDKGSATADTTQPISASDTEPSLDTMVSPERRMAVNVLCNVVAAKAESLGFNRFDVAAIVWAVGHSDVVSNNDGRALIHGENCMSSGLGLQLALPRRSNISSSQPEADATTPAAVQPSPPPNPTNNAAPPTSQEG